MPIDAIETAKRLVCSANDLMDRPTERYQADDKHAAQDNFTKIFLVDLAESNLANIRSDKRNQ